MTETKHSWTVRSRRLRVDAPLTLTPQPTVLLLQAAVSHGGGLISLPAELSRTQNTIKNLADVQVMTQRDEV